MARKLTILFLISLIMASPSFALEKGSLKSAMDDLSQGISQTAYTLQEKENSAERDVYDSAADKADRAEKEVRAMVSGIETAADLQAALDEVKEFGTGDALHSHTSAIVVKMLKERAAFLKLEEPKAGADLEAAEGAVRATVSERVAKPEDLLNLNQQKLIMVQTPVAEAVISVSDNKENRRITALEAMLDRHEIRILSSRKDESGDQPVMNYYVSGKKFVLEALMRNFNGTEVSGNLKAVMKITTGGFWGKDSVEVTVTPKAGEPEKGTLSWYQAVLEKDPFNWLAQNDYSKLQVVGKPETVGGEQKLRLKNAKLEIWVIAANGTLKDAIYFNSTEFGDVYVAAK